MPEPLPPQHASRPQLGSSPLQPEMAPPPNGSVNAARVDSRLRPPPPTPDSHRGRLHSLFRQLLREHRQPNRMGAAVFVGILIGASPLYGFHLLLCLIFATALRLNKLTVYLVANISNPLVAPFLLAVEVLIGEWILHGTVTWLDPANIQNLGLTAVAYRFFVSALVGSLAVGTGLGAVLGLGTTLWLRRKARGATNGSDRDRVEDQRLADDEARFRHAVGKVAAALRQAAIQRGQGHFRSSFLLNYSQSKISMDPVYRNLVSLLPPSGTVIDIGTGLGFVPLLLAELYPDRPGDLVGFDYDTTKVADGQAAAKLLGTRSVRLEIGDAMDKAPGNAAAICLIDVLHYLDSEGQRSLIHRCTHALSPGGMLLVRDMPQRGGLGAILTRIGERFAMITGLNQGSLITPIEPSVLREQMESLGLEVTEHPMATGPLSDRLWIGSVPDNGSRTAANGSAGQQVHGVQNGDA